MSQGSNPAPQGSPSMSEARDALDRLEAHLNITSRAGLVRDIATVRAALAAVEQVEKALREIEEVADILVRGSMRPKEGDRAIRELARDALRGEGEQT